MARSLFSTCLMTLCCVALAASAPAADIRWGSNADYAWQTANQTGRPILVFVTKANCPYCVKMKQNTLANPGLSQQINQQFIPLVVDGARKPDWLSDVQIRGYPTMLVISTEAVLVDQIKGYVSPQELSQRLNQAQHRAQAATPLRR